MVFLSLYFFAAGLCFGSFFLVVGIRKANKQSIVFPRSSCPHCHHSLSWRELIPVISFLAQKGKCRHCQNAISPLYPIMELATGCLFLFAFLQVGLTAELFVALTFISLLMIVTASDIAYMLIPNSVLFFFAVLLIIERAFIPLSPWYDSVIGAALGFGLLYLIAIISNGGMGGGDIKLYGVIGYVLGVKGFFLSFILASLFGALFGLFAMILGKMKRKTPIPFAPFITIGSLLAYFFEQTITAYYWQLIIS